MATRKMLQDSLVKLLSKKPLSQITITEVCKEADLNRTTFYLHYANLNTLFTEIEKDANKRIKDFIQNIRDESDKIVYIAQLLSYIKENAILFQILFFYGQDTDSRIGFFQDILEFIMETPVEGATQKENRYAKLFATNGTIAMVNSWASNDFDLSEETLAKLIHDMISSAYLALAKLQLDILFF